MNLFRDPQPSFVSVHAEHFAIEAKSYSHLRCLIQKAQPIRKLFQHNKLVCYSMDGKIGHKRETYCVFCNDNFHCQRKIRLYPPSAIQHQNPETDETIGIFPD